MATPNVFRNGTGVRGGTARGGFTLIETALATIIIGVGVLALVEAQTAFLQSNSWSTQAATATYLANEIRELTNKLPRHDPVNGVYLQVSGGASTIVGWGPNPGEVAVTDFNDIDDFDGMRFAYNAAGGIANKQLMGPIDAFGSIIPEVGNDGNIVLDPSSNPLPLQGWSQEVSVVKVDPFDTSITYAKEAVLPPNPGTGFKGLNVDQFPLRVTVTVKFRGVYDSTDKVITTVSWIVP